MFTIGNIKIKHPIILAPMAGITDLPFRIICKEFGASLVYTEFVSAHGIIRKNEKTLKMIEFTKRERPIGIQIFGDDPMIVADSAKYIYKNFNPDIIDINYGCPVPKITKKGAGSAALRDLTKMEDITRAVIEAVPEIPITVKMRAGWDNKNIISTKAGIMLESIGIKAITLHGRTTKQLFSGKADWIHIKELKESINIPVIGNGDILCYDDYLRMREFTNCDAVMIGRGALGKPWIFNEIISKISKNNTFQSDLKLLVKTCKKHIKLLIENKPTKVSVNLSKKHLSYYIKGFPGASNLRKNIMKSNSIEEILYCLDKLTN